MAKLPRTTQKIFAKNAAAGQVTTFGSIKDGSPVYSTSASDIMNSNFEDGWSAAVEDDYAPYRQDRNGVDTAVTQQLAYLFQEGIPEYDSGTVYYKGSICKVTSGTGIKIYKSIYDNHSASVTNTNRWQLLLDNDSSNNIVSPSITSPTISGGSMSNGTFSDPTFSGNVNVPLASASGSTTSTIAASIGWVNDPNLSSNVVHKTGSEIISGAKTFTNNVIISKTSSRFYMDDTGYTQGTAPSSAVTYWVGFRDSAGTTIGGLSKRIETNLNSLTRVVSNKQTSSSSAYATFQVAYNSDGKYQLDFSGTNTDTGDVNNSLSKTTSSTTETYIPTMGWVNNPATSTNVVHRSGNESISGIKTFSDRIMFNGSTGLSYNTLSTAAKGTAPSSNVTTSFSFLDSAFTGSYNATISRVQLAYNSDGSTTAKLQAFKPEASSTASSSIAIYYPSSGNPYTEAPTPATSDNSTKIATTAFVKAQGYASDSDVVKITGNQTISGDKTFSGTTNVVTPASSDDSTKPATTEWARDFVEANGGLASFTKGAKGYYVFTNGLIIQWGVTTTPATDTTIALLTPFTSTNYSITITSIADAGIYQRTVDPNSSTKTTTSFKTYAGGGAANANFYWQAIGY